MANAPAKTATRPTAPVTRTPPTPAANPNADKPATTPPATDEKRELTPEEKKAAVAAAKAERFKKAGQIRVPRAAAALEAVKPLGNRKSYVYTDEQAKKIVDTLEKKMAEIRSAFAGDDGGFTL
jgi:hypothetical protein